MTAAHSLRGYDTTEAIIQAGFEIEEIERFGFSAQRFQPLIPHILGTARRPDPHSQASPT